MNFDIIYRNVKYGPTNNMLTIRGVEIASKKKVLRKRGRCTSNLCSKNRRNYKQIFFEHNAKLEVHVIAKVH